MQNFKAQCMSKMFVSQNLMNRCIEKAKDSLQLRSVINLAAQPANKIRYVYNAKTGGNSAEIYVHMDY